MNTDKLRTRITLTCDTLTALGVVGCLQLARKHPLNTGPSTVLIDAFIEQLLGKIAETGVLSTEELRQAFDAAQVDVSRHEAQRRLQEELKSWPK